MNALLIDHSLKYTNMISSLLRESLYDLQHIKIAQYLCNVKDLLDNYAPQLILCDLTLPDGRGIDVLEVIKGYPGYVICLTSSEEYAIEAIRYNIVQDFLLKPININEFLQSLARFQKNGIHKTQKNTLLPNPQENVKPKKICYKSNNSVEFIDLDNVIRIEAMRSYCKAILKNNRSIVYSKSLSKIEEEVHGHQFFRVHKSHLVNLSYVEKITTNGGTTIKMKDNSLIPVSRIKKKPLLSTFKYYI